jgi:hypothetical protein
VKKKQMRRVHEGHGRGARTESIERSQAFGEASLLGECGLIQAMVVEAIHRDRRSVSISHAQ